MKSPKNLILYKDFENGNLFYNMTWIMENYENEYYNKEDVEFLLSEEGKLAIVNLHVWGIMKYLGL